MLVECPHCHVPVYPSAGNLCPACRKNLDDTTGADSTKTRVEIRREDQLPSCCYLCGVPTDRKVKWQFRDSRGYLPWWKVILSLLFLRLLSFLVLARTTSGHNFRLKLSLPQCESCACTPEAEYVDMDKGGGATFIVHRGFAELLRGGKTPDETA